MEHLIDTCSVQREKSLKKTFFNKQVNFNLRSKLRDHFQGAKNLLLNFEPH